MSKKPTLQSPKGMHDIIPADEPYWNFILKEASQILGYYAYDHIETPIVESTALFVRSVGKATDIVEKEMYNFKTKGGDELSLRPEGTAGAARAYIEHGMQVLSHPVQLWYYGPFFRHENPQAGRYRQLHQLGVESFGDDSPAIDAQIIFIASKIVEATGLKNMVVHINSIGDDNCRPQYIKVLKDYYRNHSKDLCAKCKERLKTNVLRVLDCTEKSCRDVSKEVPQTVDYLDEECKKHFKGVLEFLDDLGVTYVMDHRLVRGLDYYTRTVFEISEEKEDGSQLSILGGGRYDDLVETLGGPKTPAAGWGMGLERTIMLMKEQGIEVPSVHPAPKVFITQLGELGKRRSLLLFEELRKAGIPAKASFGRDSIKSQLRIANRWNIKYTLLIGQKEALDSTVIIREMDSGVQETVPFDRVIEIVKQRLGM